MSWYENPTVAAIIGAVVGAAMTAAASIFIWQKTSRVRRIDCVINDASSLLTFADTIRSKLEVKYAGEQATSVFLFNLEVFNSGNQAVGNHPVLIRLDNNAKIFDLRRQGLTVRSPSEKAFATWRMRGLRSWSG
jgi:hypothetical protein